MTVHPLTLRFADADLERDYCLDHAERAAPQLRRYAWLVLALAVVQALVPAPPGTAAAQLSLSMVFAAMGLLGMYLTRPGSTRHHAGAAAAVSCAVLSVLYLLFGALGPPEAREQNYVLLAAHAVATGAALRLRFTQLAPIIAGTLAAFPLVQLGFEAQAARPIGEQSFMLFAFSLLGAFAGHQMDAAGRAEFVQRRAVAVEKERSDALLRNILPDPIAARLKAAQQPIADGFADVTVLFADLVGFTPLSARLPPEQVVELLDRVFSRFDDLADRHGLEKIKTIGDCYMVAAGLPAPCADHADRAASMALDMQTAVAEVAADLGEPLQLRIGLNSGEVVAGVIGRRKFIYDLWGDAVNVASRMESQGLPGAIQLTAATRARLGPRFGVEPRGVVDVKGKGPVEAFLLRAG